MVIPRLLTPVSECFPTLVSSLQMRNERQLIDLIKSTTYQNLYCALWCTCQLPPRHGRSRIQSAIHTRLFRENEQNIGEPGTPNSTAIPWWWLYSHTEISFGKPRGWVLKLYDVWSETITNSPALTGWTNTTRRRSTPANGLHARKSTTLIMVWGSTLDWDGTGGAQNQDATGSLYKRRET